MCECVYAVTNGYVPTDMYQRMYQRICTNGYVPTDVPTDMYQRICTTMYVGSCSHSTYLRRDSVREVRRDLPPPAGALAEVIAPCGGCTRCVCCTRVASPAEVLPRRAVVGGGCVGWCASRHSRRCVSGRGRGGICWGRCGGGCFHTLILQQHQKIDRSSRSCGSNRTLAAVGERREKHAQVEAAQRCYEKGQVGKSYTRYVQYTLRAVHAAHSARCVQYTLRTVHAACSTCCVQYMLRAVHAACSTCCAQYTLRTVHAACSTCCAQYTLRTVHAACSTRCVQYTLRTVHAAHSTCCVQYTLRAVHAHL
jgi:hypothetical protein